MSFKSNDEGHKVIDVDAIWKCVISLVYMLNTKVLQTEQYLDPCLQIPFRCIKIT